MEGDNSHVEMKLSSDMDDEVEANGVGENTNQHNHPYYPSKLNQRSPKTICGYVIGILFLFIIGKPICWYIYSSLLCGPLEFFILIGQMFLYNDH